MTRYRSPRVLPFSYELTLSFPFSLISHLPLHLPLVSRQLETTYKKLEVDLRLFEQHVEDEKLKSKTSSHYLSFYLSLCTQLSLSLSQFPPLPEEDGAPEKKTLSKPCSIFIHSSSSDPFLLSLSFFPCSLRAQADRDRATCGHSQKHAGEEAEVERSGVGGRDRPRGAGLLRLPPGVLW